MLPVTEIPMQFVTVIPCPVVLEAGMRIAFPLTAPVHPTPVRSIPWYCVMSEIVLPVIEIGTPPVEPPPATPMAAGARLAFPVLMQQLRIVLPEGGDQTPWLTIIRDSAGTRVAHRWLRGQPAGTKDFDA